MHLPRAPAGCTDLDLGLVGRTLAKHYGDIPASARELGVSIPDLRRLTWAKPKLLEEAELERMGVVARAWGELIEALYSDDPRRQMWASDRIMSSWLARDHPLAPARRGARGVETPQRQVTFRGADDDPATDKLERDGQTIAVPRYGAREVEAAKPPALIEAPSSSFEAPPPESSPSPPQLPRWPGPGGPPPLVQHLYAPQSPFQPRRAPEPEAPQPGARRRPSRGGYR
jgi:hypothetical protein